MRLLSVRPAIGIAIPGVSGASTMTITPGEGQWKAWRVHVRGPRVFIVAPLGWDPDKKHSAGERRIFDIPRESCTLTWAGDEAGLETMAKWSPAVERTQLREASPPATDVEGANPSVQETPPAPPAAVQPASTQDEEPDDAPPPEWGGKPKAKGMKR